ncbi:MAG TPA: VOC family protein [Gammaproteobacteria bacterium]
MPRVVHFELHADVPERAIAFYSHCFGWEFHKWEGPFDYWLITTGPKEQVGIDGGMMKRMVPIDSKAVIAYVGILGVEDLDSTIATVVKRGGTVEVPMEPIPGVGWLAYFKDTEGNIFGALQPDMETK